MFYFYMYLLLLQDKAGWQSISNNSQGFSLFLQTFRFLSRNGMRMLSGFNFISLLSPLLAT